MAFDRKAGSVVYPSALTIVVDALLSVANDSILSQLRPLETGAEEAYASGTESRVRE